MKHYETLLFVHIVYTIYHKAVLFYFALIFKNKNKYSKGLVIYDIYLVRDPYFTRSCHIMFLYNMFFIMSLKKSDTLSRPYTYKTVSQ